jgi:deferrochelatase/peroxidase EfeB
MTDVERDDIQGLVARGYPDLKSAAYLLLQIEDPSAARKWLNALLPSITPAPAHPDDAALNLAFTAAGLEALGLRPDALAQFSNQFTAGMTTPHRRRMFGDEGPSAPETWLWGGPSTPPPHLLLLLFARDADTLNQRYATLSASYQGVAEIQRLDAFTDLDGREHFGFVDGISRNGWAPRRGDGLLAEGIAPRRRDASSRTGWFLSERIAPRRRDGSPPKGPLRAEGR